MATRKYPTCAAALCHHLQDSQYRPGLGEEWHQRHSRAWINPRPGGERAIKLLIAGYAEMADQSQTFEHKLGQDGYFHEHAADLIHAMRAYLNFDVGRFDCGSLDRLICGLAEISGVELEP